MARFNIGDKIKVKEWDVVKCTRGAVSDMRRYAGKIGRIIKVDSQDSFHISIDNGEWYWDIHALIPISKDNNEIKRLKSPYNWIDLIEKNKIGTL